MKFISVDIKCVHYNEDKSIWSVLAPLKSLEPSYTSMKWFW